MLECLQYASHGGGCCKDEESLRAIPGWGAVPSKDIRARPGRVHRLSSDRHGGRCPRQESEMSVGTEG